MVSQLRRYNAQRRQRRREKIEELMRYIVFVYCGSDLIGMLCLYPHSQERLYYEWINSNVQQRGSVRRPRALSGSDSSDSSSSYQDEPPQRQLQPQPQPPPAVGRPQYRRPMNAYAEREGSAEREDRHQQPQPPPELYRVRDDSFADQVPHRWNPRKGPKQNDDELPCSPSSSECDDDDYGDEDEKVYFSAELDIGADLQRQQSLSTTPPPASVRHEPGALGVSVCILPHSSNREHVLVTKRPPWRCLVARTWCLRSFVWMWPTS